MKKLFLIINPISGGIKKNKAISRITHQLAEQFDIHIRYTQKKGDGSILASVAKEQHADVVLVVGGDGTLNEVCQSLIDSDTCVGVIPMGSGNGIARHLKIPMDLNGAIRVIRYGFCKKIDVAQINEHYYVGMAGIGYDAEISWAFSSFSRRGFLSYLFLTIKHFFNYQSKDYELVIDGIKRKVHALLIAFANGSQFGNGACIAPNAVIDDQLLNGVIVKPFPWIAGFQLGYALFCRRLKNSKYITCFTFKEISCSGSSLKGHVDGEPILFSNGFHLKIIPTSLKFLVPGNYS